MRDVIRRWPVTGFAVLACGFTWAWVLPFVFAGRVVHPGVGWPTHFPGLLGPAVAAIVVTAVADGRSGLLALRRRVLRWRQPRQVWGLVLATTVGVGAIAALVTGGISYSGLSRFSGLPAGSPALTLLLLITVNGFGEEIGWRGFALDRLRTRHGPIAASLLVALPWAVWHLPQFWLLASYRDLGLVGVPGFLLGLVAGAIVLGWLYEWSGRSVPVVAVWHGLYNWVVATDGGGPAVAGAVTALVMIAAVAICWFGRRKTGASLSR